MAQIEFFTDAVGTMYYRENGKLRELHYADCDIVLTMYELIKRKFPLTFKSLTSLYDDKLTIVKRFIACNLMNDDIASFDLNDETINVEDVRCPLRGGLCKWEGKICRCKNQFDIDEDDFTILKLLKKGLGYSEIAKSFNIGIEALRQRVSRLKKLTGAKNKVELINLYVI